MTLGQLTNNDYQSDEYPPGTPANKRQQRNSPRSNGTNVELSYGPKVADTGGIEPCPDSRHKRDVMVDEYFRFDSEILVELNSNIRS